MAGEGGKEEYRNIIISVKEERDTRGLGGGREEVLHQVGAGEGSR